jgi:hypothetical protein
LDIISGTSFLVHLESLYTPNGFELSGLGDPSLLSSLPSSWAKLMSPGQLQREYVKKVQNSSDQWDSATLYMFFDYNDGIRP